MLGQGLGHRPVRQRRGAHRSLLEDDADPGPAEYGCWIRLLEHERAPDELACARRQVLFIDLPPWNALIAGLDWPLRHLAPNLDLTVQFHQFAPEANWLLTEGVAPHGQDGLVDAKGYVLNDETVSVLVDQAVNQANAGADIILMPPDLLY